MLAGLVSHKGPILTVANWSGQWPGLVGMLNLNGSLTKAAVAYSTLWSETFDDSFFSRGLREWIETGRVTHDESHVSRLPDGAVSADVRAALDRVRDDLLRRKAIVGVFDEGCMGMYNAIVPDELLMKLGMFKERLSQSALYFAAKNVSDSEARACLDWLKAKGMTFHFGKDAASELTEAQSRAPHPDVVHKGRCRSTRRNVARDRRIQFGCSGVDIRAGDRNDCLSRRNHTKSPRYADGRRPRSCARARLQNRHELAAGACWRKKRRPCFLFPEFDSAAKSARRSVSLCFCKHRFTWMGD